MRKHGLLVMMVLCVMAGNSQQTFAITGQVIDDHQQPVANALVRLLNTNRETISGNDGKFSLGRIARGWYEIAVSAEGYAQAVQTTRVEGDVSDLRFTLRHRTLALANVVVTSSKREEAINLVPISVTVLDEHRISNLRLWNNRDLTAVIPNLYAANPGDGRNVTSVRGITSTSYDPAVTTYIDGVAQFNLDTYIPQLFDVERIEVLRGPQGTLYGRNSMGGVINIISSQPLNRTDGFAEISLGNRSMQRYTAAIRTALVKDHLFAGMAGLYENTNGFYRNVFSDKHFDKQHASAGNYWLKYLSGRRWKATLNVKHLMARNDGAFPMAGSLEDAFAEPYKVNQDAATRLVDNTFNTSLSVSYSVKQINITSQTAWQSNYRYYRDPIDGDFSPIDGITIINNYGRKYNRVHAFTQELRATGGKATGLRWTAGIYLFTQGSPNKQATHFGEDAQLVGSPDINYAIVTTNTVRNRGASLFGQVDQDIAGNFFWSAGLRVDRQRTAANVLGEYLPDGSPEPVFETRSDTSARRHFTAVSPKLSLGYKIYASGRVSLSYSRGFRTGGLTQLGSDPSLPPLYGYDPEYSHNIELVFKNSLWQNRVQANLSLFTAVVNDVQVPTLVLPDALTITRNAGKLRTRGADLDIIALLLKGLTLTYSGGITHARFASLQKSQNGSAVNLKGNRQIFTPSGTSFLALQYDRTIGKRSGLAISLRGEWMYIGRTYFDFGNNLTQPGYQLFNTRLAFSLRAIEVSGWLRNMGNTRYATYAYEFGAARLGDPRTYGVTARARF